MFGREGSSKNQKWIHANTADKEGSKPPTHVFYERSLKFSTYTTMVNLDLEHDALQRQFHNCLKNKMYDINKMRLFKNDGNIFTFDGTKMSILR